MLLPPIALATGLGTPLLKMWVAPGELGDVTHIADARRDGRAIGTTGHKMTFGSSGDWTFVTWKGRTGPFPTAFNAPAVWPIAITGPRSYLFGASQAWSGKPVFYREAWITGEKATYRKARASTIRTFVSRKPPPKVNRPTSTVRVRPEWRLPSAVRQVDVRWRPLGKGVQVGSAFYAPEAGVSGSLALVRFRGQVHRMEDVVKPVPNSFYTSVVSLLFVSPEGWLVASVGDQGRGGLAWVAPIE